VFESTRPSRRSGLSGTPTARFAQPALGAHTEEVLGERLGTMPLFRGWDPERSAGRGTLT